ncbi:PepSY domain-containing protein [Methylobacterium radiodurans]|nr:PepSY domain-containing protein [Methylobacterium radiodurans]
MIMRLTRTLVAVCALALAGGAYAKDRPGSDWISKDDLKKQMQSEGYSAIVVGVDDGHWEGEAVKDGRIVEFHADGKTGKITKSKPKTED